MTKEEIKKCKKCDNCGDDARYYCSFCNEYMCSECLKLHKEFCLSADEIEEITLK